MLIALINFDSKHEDLRQQDFDLIVKNHLSLYSPASSSLSLSASACLNNI